MPDDALYAGIDLGGTNTKCVLATAAGDVAASASMPTEAHAGPEAVLDRIAATVEALADEAGRAPAALGMGCPGLVDVEQGVARFFPNLPTQWRGVPVREILSARLGCPVYLLNDARTATLGELTYGRGREARCMVFFTLGTGIGGGVAVDRKLRLGPLGAAGELGHQTILPDGPRCGCGNRGCLETLASGPAIAAQGVRLVRSGLAPQLHALTDGDLDRITPKTMTAAAEAGDDAVRDALVRASRYLGIGVANAVVALHPDLVVLGGGVAEMGDLLFDTVRQVVRERVGMFPVDDVAVEPSLLGGRAGTLGAVALAVSGPGNSATRAP